jgi:hypothetical protein
MNNGSRHISESNFGALLGGIAIDAKDLLMRQVALTKLEVRCELSKGLASASALGIGLGIVAAGGMLLMLMLVQGLAALTMVPLWGCYGIAGSALVVLGGVVLAAGRTNAEELDLVPRRAVERIKEHAQWLTKQRS